MQQNCSAIHLSSNIPIFLLTPEKKVATLQLIIVNPRNFITS